MRLLLRRSELNRRISKSCAAKHSSCIATALSALFAMAMSLPGAASDCDHSLLDEAKELKEARKSRDAMLVIKKQLRNCEDFAGWMFAGELYEGSRKYSDAKKAYTSAKELAVNSEEQADAVAGYGSTLLASGRRAEALPILQAALKQYENPPAELIEKTRQLDLAMNSGEAQDQLITRGFSNQAFSILAIDRSINIRMNFLSNSTVLDAPSERRLPALISELSKDKYEGKTIWLIGHSDSRGEKEYNMKLSWARAEAVQSEIIKAKPELKDRLSVNGKGELEPLYPGLEDSDYVLNRRLQLVVE